MDNYFNAFYDIVKETQETSGYNLPVDLESYIVMLLSHHIDKPDWLPEKSFAEVCNLANASPTEHQSSSVILSFSAPSKKDTNTAGLSLINVRCSLLLFITGSGHGKFLLAKNLIKSK